MLSRRRFSLATAAAIMSPRLSLAATQPLLRFGLAADAQYADIEIKGTRFYRASIPKLTEAVAHFNAKSPDFCVHLGDLIDRQWRSFDEILKPLKEARQPVYHLLGNHDFSVLDALKPQVTEKMGMPRRYYTFDKAGFRFVALDTTEVSTYATQQGTVAHTAANAELKRLEALHVVQAQSWNSGISQTQVAWFDTACKEAADKGLKVIVFAHHPIAPAGIHNLWNCDAVLEVLTRRTNIVAWLNGHNHAGAFAEHQGVPLITVHGMVETADTNAYAMAELHADRLIITGHGREPSREIVFRSLAAIPRANN
jgi:3',5'-cyclic AMP phosphodiesterase CpdA